MPKLERRKAIRQIYADAAEQTRLEYARYLADMRKTTEKPKTFTNWLKDLK